MQWVQGDVSAWVLSRLGLQLVGARQWVINGEGIRQSGDRLI